MFEKYINLPISIKLQYFVLNYYRFDSLFVICTDKT